jgi:CBS domain-containing protein
MQGDGENMSLKRVGEIMIPLDEYPHILDQSSLAEAIKLLASAELNVGGRRSLPRFLLVFDRNSQLVGILRRRDLLRGLEPRFLSKTAGGPGERLFDVDVDPNLLEFSLGHIVDGMRRRAHLSVRDVMIKDVITIDYDDHLMKAIFEIVHHDVTCLPVIRNGEVVGVVRTVELFRAVANLVI